MGAFTEVIQSELPGVYVSSIRIGETESEDKNKGFFDEVNRQVDEVCETLKADPELAGGFNAIGFSQGGQFFRAYVQRCNDPPVHNLITFGAQHAGVSEWPGCKDKLDASCALARSLLLRGAYLSWVQHRVVQAQYFKDSRNYAEYLEKNIFLPDINNEHPDLRNKTYVHNLNQLNKFVMLQFENDETVVPKESAWFGYWNEEGEVIPIKDQPLYKEDWLGLKSMDEKGKLIFEEIPGKHMEIAIEYVKDVIVPKYLSEKVAFVEGARGGIVVQQAR
ncbi:Palmitoyl-protein thioesterase 1 [Borealophlyctis nickersoniae]|nr:Palmitoyl-protein thioesterase 1 [Borealophlyctis nickersoniae]